MISRSRFTVRWLMVAVAVLALLIWSVMVSMRWNDYRRRAEYHDSVANTLLGEIGNLQEQGGQADQVNMRREVMADEIRLARRCRRAMLRPWLPITSTPPEPE
jgi:hypothetical protein